MTRRIAGYCSSRNQISAFRAFRHERGQHSEIGPNASSVVPIARPVAEVLHYGGSHRIQ